MTISNLFDKVRGGIRIFPTERLRELFVRRMVQSKRFNYFVGYRDVQGPGLSYANAEWAGDFPHVQDVFERTSPSYRRGLNRHARRRLAEVERRQAAEAAERFAMTKQQPRPPRERARLLADELRQRAAAIRAGGAAFFTLDDPDDVLELAKLLERVP